MAWTDSKSQVTMSYDDVNTPTGITKIVCSTQHSIDDMSIQAVRDRVEQITLDELNGTFDLMTLNF